MNVFTRLFVVISLLINSGAGFAAQGFWRDVTTSSKLLSEEATSIRYFDSDEQALRDFLALVPHESSGDNSYTILLPMPDGTQSSYSIVESPIMEAGLAAKYPDIKSYLVYGIDDPGASGRVDISPKGFRGMIYTSQGRVFIDPDWQNSAARQYLSRSSQSQSSDSAFQCSTNQLVSNQMSSPVLSQRTANRIPGSLLEYRLAVSATQEYVLAPNVNTNGTGNELSDALAEINTAINRVNVIYQRDLGIKLVLVGNNDLVIDINGDSILAGLDSDGFPLNNNGFEMLSVNQSWVDTQIGSANYDIGHVFTTGGGGIASIRSVCDGSIKAQGVTGLLDPTGEVFYIDFVAHEIGHQFGAEHTFNGTTGSCGFGNRSLLPNTFEPGSGSTIMAYAGICGTENIQPNSDATFHAGSIEQINSFVTGAGCGVGRLISPSNADPVAVAGGNQVIPISTSFQLNGSGTDVDIGDTVSFQWDQMDAGTATSATTIGDDLVDNALFRTYPPQSTGNRDFPALGTQVRDGPYDQSETLPCTVRNLNFRLTVRDGKSGQATDNLQITVDDASGPFKITSFDTPETIFTNSGSVILNWDVANTDSGAVNCPNVDIDLLTFSSGHTEYSVTPLATLVLNNGNALFPFPNATLSSAKARFRVKCSSGIFYDISDADLVITGTGLGTDVYSTSGNQTFFNTNGQVFATSAGNCSVATSPPPSSGGGGTISIPWILYLLGLAYRVRFTRRLMV